MKKFTYLKTMLLLCALIVGSSAWAGTVDDVLNQEWTGVSGTSYKDWSGKAGTSGAVYAGNSAGGNSSIQLRSNNNNSGVVTTTSGGKAKKIVVEWNSNTAAGRTLNVYGKSTAYSAASDLYDNEKQGTLLGTIVNGTSTALTIEGDYAFIGFRSASGAMYLSSVTITWESEATLKVLTPTISGDESFLKSTEVTIACGTTGAAIQYSTNGGASWTNYSEPFEITATTTVQAKATKDGMDDSDVASKTFTKIVPLAVPQALEAIDALENNGTIENQYVSGIISQIDSYSSNSITYWISADGTTTTQLEVYKGKGVDGANFSAVSDLIVGDEVVVYGTLTKYYDSKKETTIPEFKSGSIIVSLERAPQPVKDDPELVVDEEITMEVTTSIPLADLYLTDSDGEVTVTSNKPSIAKVENGVLKAISKGTAEITVSVAATETFNAASKTINVIVTVKDAAVAEGPAVAGGYVLVTDASTLKAGDKILIVNQDGDYAISTTSDGNNRPAASVTAEAGAIASIGNNVQVITLEGEADAWYFNVGDDAYLYAASSSSNYLKTNTMKTAGDNGKAKITIDEGVATIIFQGTNTRNDLRFNPNGENPLFSCYDSEKTTLAKTQIYRAVHATSFDIAVGEAGWRSLVTAVDATLPEGLTAYVVTETAASSVALEEATAIKANTPYIVKGVAGKHTLTVAEGVEAPAKNLLKISEETTGNGVYVLAKPAGKEVGFYKWAGGSLGAGRVYLSVSETGAPEFLSFSFGSETTGVREELREKSEEFATAPIFDLQGRRVAQPTKGLYIVNGRKVVIK